MRKYQQLLLLLVSCCSVGILLIYKSENNRLKYVLRVVNFFGRNDAVILRQFENATKEEQQQPDFTHPLPVWQAISEDFHAYAAYWHHNELVVGGEAMAVVVGKRGAVVNFRCSLFYDGGARSVQGKFHFQRADKEFEDTGSEFTSYNFFCRLVRDFGQPESVVFTGLSSVVKVKHQLRLRNIKPSKKAAEPPPQLLTVCVDMVTFNTTSMFARNESYIIQFFMHHQMMGVKHFLIYNGDALPDKIQQTLLQANTKGYFHFMPFNFPFDYGNDSKRIKHILETECLMRNSNRALYTLLLQPDEFFYLSGKLDDEKTVLLSIRHYATEITQFEVPTFSVCIDTNLNILIDHSHYDPEKRALGRLCIYRPHVPISTTMTQNTPRTVVLPLSNALAHRYTSCYQVGKDGLHDWRNSLREDFMQYLLKGRNELAVWMKHLGYAA